MEPTQPFYAEDAEDPDLLPLSVTLSLSLSGPHPSQFNSVQYASSGPKLQFAVPQLQMVSGQMHEIWSAISYLQHRQLPSLRTASKRMDIVSIH